MSCSPARVGGLRGWGPRGCTAEQVGARSPSRRRDREQVRKPRAQPGAPGGRLLVLGCSPARSPALASNPSSGALSQPPSGWAPGAASVPCCELCHSQQGSGLSGRWWGAVEGSRWDEYTRKRPARAPGQLGAREAGHRGQDRLGLGVGLVPQEPPASQGGRRGSSGQSTGGSLALGSATGPGPDQRLTTALAWPQLRAAPSAESARSVR